MLCSHEDYFIEKLVDSAYVDSLVEYMSNLKVAYIRLVPAPPPDSYFSNNLNLGLISRGFSHRTSLEAGLWDKKVLTDLLVDGESAHQMEENGPKRSDSVDMPFMSVIKPALIYEGRSAVGAGKWMYYAVKLCKREGIKIDLKKRKIDYFWSVNQIFEKFRKYTITKRIRSIPIVGTISAKVSRFLLGVIRKFLQ